MSASAIVLRFSVYDAGVALATNLFIQMSKMVKGTILVRFKTNTLPLHILLFLNCMICA